MRTRSFGEIGLEIDRMAGLRVREIPALGVRHWDQREACNLLPTSIEADEKIVWEGGLLKAEEVDLLMGKTHDGDQPRLCRLRSGRNGKPRQSGAIRLLSADGENFDLGLFDLRNNSELVRQIVSVRAQLKVVLTVANVNQVLFDFERDQNKLNRLQGAT